MRSAERAWFLHFTNELADELAGLVRSTAARLADTEEDAAEALWKVWDAVIEREREQRAEWVRSGLENDRVNAEARAAHPDDYEEWLDAENARVRELVLRRVRHSSAEDVSLELDDTDGDVMEIDDDQDTVEADGDEDESPLVIALREAAASGELENPNWLEDTMTRVFNEELERADSPLERLKELVAEFQTKGNNASLAAWKAARVWAATAPEREALRQAVAEIPDEQPKGSQSLWRRLRGS